MRPANLRSSSSRTLSVVKMDHLRQFNATIYVACVSVYTPLLGISLNTRRHLANQIALILRRIHVNGKKRNSIWESSTMRTAIYGKCMAWWILFGRKVLWGLQSIVGVLLDVNGKKRNSIWKSSTMRTAIYIRCIAWCEWEREKFYLGEQYYEDCNLW